MRGILWERLGNEYLKRLLRNVIIKKWFRNFGLYVFPQIHLYAPTYNILCINSFVVDFYNH